MSMTPKENLLAVLRHETSDRPAVFGMDSASCGFGVLPGPSFEKGFVGGGPDGFGVNWVAPASGAGASIPEPNVFQMDSETIVDWKKIVKFPDLAKFDWEECAKRELAGADRNLKAIHFGSGNGPFERMAALMGFEEALLAMALEPEASFELLDAIADYKVQVVELVKKYYNPDIITNYDDIATERGLFMSPDVYREMVKPAHKKMYDAIKSLGMIPVQHTCGRADSLIEDYIEAGAMGWSSVQPTNDICALLDNYGDKCCIIGGFDSNGVPGQMDTPMEVIEEEIRRCIDTYGYSRNYIFAAFRIVNSTDPMDLARATGPLMKYGFDYMMEKESKKA